MNPTTLSKAARSADDEELVEKSVTILLRELGSVQAGRLLAMPARQRMESVQRHRIWQQGLDQTRFFDEVFEQR